jgi:hypothetical protein
MVVAAAMLIVPGTTLAQDEAETAPDDALDEEAVAADEASEIEERRTDEAR